MFPKMGLFRFFPTSISYTKIVLTNCAIKIKTFVVFSRVNDWQLLENNLGWNWEKMSLPRLAREVGPTGQRRLVT